MVGSFGPKKGQKRKYSLLQGLKIIQYNSQVKKAWKIFDKNGDGKLTPQEFRYDGGGGGGHDDLQVDDPPKFAL